MLETNEYVHLVSFDFSKPFDTVRHSSLFSKLAQLAMPDHVYNWLLDFFGERQHCTRFNSQISTLLPISASVVQGSALGPVAFIINASDLHTVSDSNKLFKYADDIYMLVPASNSASIPLELSHISNWASANNLRLNQSKTHELIVTRKNSRRTSVPPATTNLNRVLTLTILGVTMNGNLDAGEHVSSLISRGGQSLYALKTLKAHGLAGKSLLSVCKSTFVSSFMYASPAWSGFSSLDMISRLEAMLKKSKRWGLTGGLDLETFSELSDRHDQKLFSKVKNNPYHVLHSLLPPVKSCGYHLRTRVHNFTLPSKSVSLCRNFLYRMLFKDVY